jgi:hypothetical protein
LKFTDVSEVSEEPPALPPPAEQRSKPRKWPARNRRKAKVHLLLFFKI